MQVARIGRDERGMWELVCVVKHTHGAGEPAQICLIAHNDRIVAARIHEVAQTGDTPCRSIDQFSHADSFHSIKPEA